MIVFSHPLFLTALASIGIPILLHFMMRPRPKKLTFPAFQFLQSRERSCRQTLRLKQWLLLALRILLLVVLVLLFARPAFWFHGHWGQNSSRSEAETSASAQSSVEDTPYSNSPTAVIFLFDTSVRMDYVFENQTRLERAQAQAIHILSGLPAQSMASVVSTHLAPLAFSPDRNEIQRQIEQLETGTTDRTIPEVLPDAVAFLATSELEQREIFIFTDQTAASWEVGGTANRQALEEALEKLPNVRISILSVGVENAKNCRLSLPDEKTFRTLSGGTVEVQTRLFADDGRAHRVGFFLLDEMGAPQLRGEMKVEAAENSEDKTNGIPLVFQAGGLKTGSNQGFFALLEGDSLLVDNFRGFTIQKDPPIPVLIVANVPADKNAFFVRQALAPMEFSLENRADFECDVLSFEQFSQWLSGERGAERSGNRSGDGSALGGLPVGQLERYHSLFFLDPPGFTASEWNRLAQYVNAGGGAAFFLGPSLRSPKEFQIAEARQILPSVPAFQARFPDGTTLNPLRQTVHPILRAFQALNVPIPWEESPVFRAWSLTQTAEGAQELFTWDGGTTAILSRDCGAGRVLLAGTSIQATQKDSREVWNLLPQGDSWVFLVLIHSTARYLAATEDVTANIRTQEALFLPLRGTLEDRFSISMFPYKIPDAVKSDAEKTDAEKADAEKADAEKSKVVLVPDLERHQIDIPGLELVGNYRITGSKNEYRRGFSVNLPLDATDLSRVEEAEIRELFLPLNVTFLSEAESLVRSLSGIQSSGELFNWLGLILLGLLLAENWLANRFYPNT